MSRESHKRPSLHSLSKGPSEEERGREGEVTLGDSMMTCSAQLETLHL